MKKLKRKGELFLLLALLIIVGVWIYIQRVEFLADLRYALTHHYITLLIFLITYLADRMTIAYGDFKLVTNVVGVMSAVMFLGWRIASLFPVVVFLRPRQTEAEDIAGKLRIFSRYVFTYYVAGVFMSLAPHNMIWLRIIVYLAVAKLVNYLLVDFMVYGRPLSKLLLGEFAFFLGLTPSFIAIGYATDLTLKTIYLSLPMITLIASNQTLRAMMLAWKEREDRKRLEKVNNQLMNLLSMMRFIRATVSPEKVLKDIATVMGKGFGYKYVLVNLFDRNTGLVERLAYYGMSEEDFKRLKENPPTIEEVIALFKDKFKVSKSYFIPEGELPLDESKVFFGEYDTPTDETNWHPGDMFLVPIYDLDENIIGYISLDGPLSGKRPIIEDIRFIEIVAEITGRVIQDSFKYLETLESSFLDAMTGLLNHATFYTRLNSFIKLEKHFSIAMMDMDDFKKINDQYGHRVGDSVLRALADFLKASFRSDDVVARYGGDEFSVILPDVGAEKAKNILERIIKGVAELKPLGIKTSISAGISHFPSDATTSNELVEKADMALYRAKRMGKGQVVLYRELESVGE